MLTALQITRTIFETFVYTRWASKFYSFSDLRLVAASFKTACPETISIFLLVILISCRIHVPVGVLALTLPAHNGLTLPSHTAKLPKQERGGLLFGALQVGGVCSFCHERGSDFYVKNLSFLFCEINSGVSLCSSLLSKCTFDQQPNLSVSFLDWQTLKSDHYCCTKSTLKINKCVFLSAKNSKVKIKVRKMKWSSKKLRDKSAQKSFKDCLYKSVHTHLVAREHIFYSSDNNWLFIEVLKVVFRS